MIATLLLLAAACALMFLGGDWFVGAAAGIARRLGMPRFVVGATVVSLGTTLPEILTSCLAAAGGKTDMAVGNALGSASVNLGLILGLGVALHPVAVPRRQVFWKGVLLLAGVALAWFFSHTGRLLTAPESMGLLALFGCFILENTMGWRAQAPARTGRADEKTRALGWEAARFAAGLAGILWGARIFVARGSVLARLAGVSEGVVALTVIAFGTSLPELVTLLAALRRREMSLSAGNILGACVIDVVLVPPLCALLSPRGVAVPRLLVARDFPACLFFAALAVAPVLWTGKFHRWQGVLLLLFYAAYLGVLFG
ncbi:MAG: calcium/sodium antiporter [Kiritimatiellaeota bacterium]|nr:calcium/sodium antiporter [Kiritimatiellota bacterium]